MTRVSESTTSPLSNRIPDGVEAALSRIEESASKVTESEAYDRAVRLAWRTASVAARGAGQFGLFLGRQGLSLAEKGVERARSLPAAQVVPDAVRPLISGDATEQKKSGTRRRIALVLVVGVAVAGGAAVFRSRRREQPRVASAPPSLRDQGSREPREQVTPEDTSVSAQG